MTASEIDRGAHPYQNFEALQNLLPRTWAAKPVRLGGGPEHGDLTHLATPNMALLRVRWQPKSHLRLTIPADQIVLLVPASRRHPMRMNGRTLDDNQIGLMHAAQTHDLVTGPEAGMVFLVFDRQTFLTRAAEIWRYLPARMAERHQLIFHRRSGVAQVLKSVESLLEILRLRPEYQRQPNCQVFEDGLVEIIATNSTPDMLQRPATRHQKADATAAYLAAHLAEPVSITTLCQQLDTSERLLRRGFSERFGLPPTAYLRVLRLHHIRRTLCAGSADVASVTHVASHCGITHLGRFSADYRYFFGEYPSTTLRRSDYSPPGLARSNPQAAIAAA